jgi:hypothetical protein
MPTADQINLAIAIATAASTVASLCVVYLTLHVLRANRAAVEVMQAQLESVTRPFILVVAAARPTTTFLELTITNTGGSAANNLRLTLDRDYYFNSEESEGSNLRRYPAFIHPIDSFSPKASLTFGLGVGFRVLNSNRSPLRFTVTAEYDWTGRHFVDRSRIDLQPFKQTLARPDPIVEKLDRIADAVEAMSPKNVAQSL